MPDDNDPPRKHYQLKSRTFETVNPPDRATSDAGADAAAYDVKAILAANLARANAAGLNEIAPAPPRRSRRRRDYLRTLVLGNAVIIAIAMMVGINLTVAVATFSGIIVFSIGLTWILWFVMDDY